MGEDGATASSHPRHCQRVALLQDRDRLRFSEREPGRCRANVLSVVGRTSDAPPSDGDIKTLAGSEGAYAGIPGPVASWAGPGRRGAAAPPLTILVRNEVDRPCGAGARLSVFDRSLLNARCSCRGDGCDDAGGCPAAGGGLSAAEDGAGDRDSGRGVPNRAFFRLRSLALDFDGRSVAYGKRDQGQENICVGLAPNSGECLGRSGGARRRPASAAPGCAQQVFSAWARAGSDVGTLGKTMCAVRLGGGGCSMPHVRLQESPHADFLVSETSLKVGPDTGAPPKGWAARQAAQVDPGAVNYTVAPTGLTVDHVGWPCQPRGLTSAQLNLPYCVATLLLEDDMFVDQFAPGELSRHSRSR